LVFVWFTAEEKGLMGSCYFAKKPSIEKSKIVADINMDMPGGIFDFKNMVPLGYKISNLSEAVDFAADALELEADTLSPLEDEYFERSDHFSFIEEKIPSLFIFGGNKAVDPSIDGEKVYRKWEKKVYHSPSDDMNQVFSKEAFLKGIRINFLCSWYVADKMDHIAWKKQSQQYKKYVEGK
jgi:Zn-dependent M28 family amino/carboxypeptidase